MRGREDFCDRLDTIGNKLLQLVWRFEEPVECNLASPRSVSNCDSRRAACSSGFGIVRVLRGMTLDLADRRVQWVELSAWIQSRQRLHKPVVRHLKTHEEM